MTYRILRMAVSALVMLGPGAAYADLAGLQQSWAEAMYATPAEDREAAMASLADSAQAELSAHPGDPALMIWNGIILSTYAGEKGGLGGLGLAKEARALLEQSLERDPDALDGSAHTSLGSLYYKVPGWPIGFGSERRAREQLEAALRINPKGIDPNYFMGEFLYESGDYEAARAHLETALAAPDRPGRDLADTGRRREIHALLVKAQQKLD